MMRLVIGCLLTLCWATTLAADLPGDSLYRLQIPMQTAEGSTVALADLRGRPVLITLFYSECSSVCPMITVRLQNIDRHLTPRARRDLTVLMLSLDSDRDSPQALRTFKQHHHIDDPRWIVARADAGDVRALAAVLGVRYRKLPDESFNHSAVITLVDREGVIKAHTEGVTESEVAFARKVEFTAAAGRH